MNATGFRNRLLLAALLPSLLVAVLLAGLWLNWSTVAQEKALQRRVEASAAQLATSAEYHLFSGDNARLRQLAAGVLKEDADLLSASIVDIQGHVLARESREGAGDVMRVSRPIHQHAVFLDDYYGDMPPEDAERVAGHLLGHAVLEVSRINLDQERHRLLWTGAGIILAVLILAGFMVIWLSRSVTEPLGRVIRMVDAIGAGDTGVRLASDTRSVLYPLEEGLNRMASQVALSHEELQAQVREATNDLRRQKRLAEREARVDPLTGIPNRRAFMERLELEFGRAVRYQQPLTLIIADLDWFKRINDLHGHGAGDEVLKAVALGLSASLRDVDFVARLGGEEFVVLMPDTTGEAGRQAAERMRQAIAALRVAVDGEELSCTASLGVAQLDDDRREIHDVMIQADHALYRAKTAGRNRVWLHAGSGVHGNGVEGGPARGDAPLSGTADS